MKFETTALQKSKALTEHVPNSVPHHIVTTGLHNSDNVVLLVLVERRLDHHHGLEQVVADFFPLRHDGGKEDEPKKDANME